MLDHFQTLLQDAVTHPDRRLSELRLLTDQERHQALVEWNATEAAPAGPATVHELIEAQAARTPDVVAAVFEHEELSYRELMRRADRLAHHLRARGVGPDTVVGLCVERSLEMLVGVLGILKAGGAYLPLDSTYPPQRLALMLSDAAARLVVTRRERLDILPADALATVCLDDEERWTDPGVGAPRRHSGEQLAYVIYTSGSTGRPKGVQVTHRALVNLLSSMGPYSGVRPGDVLLTVSPLIFDIATLELLLPLTVGARVAIATRETAQDGRLLAAALARAGATMMQATPTTWRMLVDSGWGNAQGLRALCGGEPLTSDLARELLARGVVLWNLYGPTETTIYSAAAPVRADTRPTLENRVANTRLYLLDRHLSPVPIGVPGELFIGGTGLARGYAGSPGLTAERFLPDPFDDRTGARMYRTGDVLRRRVDGAIEFLGRTDHQIKLRGFRIELGEIEAALEAHPAVSQVAVVVREDEPGDRRLVAYLVPAPGQASTVSDLRGSLRRTLPDYMLPSAFVLLDSLPCTGSGKLDRSALPPPDRQAGDSSLEHVAPMGALEQVLAEICGEVLGVPHIGAHDDFFALGGHSLLATRVVSRIEAALGIELPLRHLFESPTVAGLAERIVALERSGEL
jgi:amino acid adenylation domain-containing protein